MPGRLGMGPSCWPEIIQITRPVANSSSGRSEAGRTPGAVVRSPAAAPENCSAKCRVSRSVDLVLTCQWMSRLSGVISRSEPSPPLLAWLLTRMRTGPMAATAASTTRAGASGCHVGTEIAEPGPIDKRGADAGPHLVEVVGAPRLLGVVRRVVVDEDIRAELGKPHGDRESDPAPPGDAGDDRAAAEQRKVERRGGCCGRGHPHTLAVPSCARECRPARPFSPGRVAGAL